MRFLTLVAVLGLATLEVTNAVPSGYASPNTMSLKKVYLRRIPCGQQAGPCYNHPRSYVVPLAPVATDAKVPLLRQVFTTTTRKHDNLNTARAEDKKGVNVKYQAGPSLEVEGDASASEYGKYRGAEHLEDDTSYPHVLTEDVQYPESVTETQCIDDCADQDMQFEGDSTEDSQVEEDSTEDPQVDEDSIEDSQADEDSASN